MGTKKSWSTKEDVLRDLAEATGRQVSDVEEEYLVVGENPPPRYDIEVEDDVRDLLFGGLANGNAVQNDSMPPDLKGITHMLNMVNHEDDDDDINDAECSSNTVVTVSKIMKLNPNVKEFIPSNGAIYSSQCSNFIDHNKNNILANKFPKTDNNICTKEKGNIVNNGTTSVQNVNNIKSDDIRERAEQLKNKISDSSKSNTFEHKLQKNVALASLLKLLASKPSNSSNTSCSGGIKLLTPKHFDTKGDKLLNDNVCGKEEDHTASGTPKSLSLDLENLSKDQEHFNNNNCPSTKSQKEKPMQQDLEYNTNNKDIKMSIEKVNKWLDEPAKAKSPTVVLSPISFKRKEPISSKTSTDKTVAQNPKPIIAKYKPSSYATDLGKQYLERSKTKENVEQNVMWSNLDVVLKKRDLEIKRRLMVESSDSQH